MTTPTDERLLAFLEGSMNEEDRLALLDDLDADPVLAERVRAAAAGLEAMTAIDTRHDASPAPAPVVAGRRGISPWWAAVAAMLTLALSVPATWLAATSMRPAADAAIAPSGAGPGASGGAASGVGVPANIGAGAPESPDPTYVLVLHGRWPDAAAITPEETRRRAREYWAWTTSLAQSGLLVAAGDLRWEPGERLGPAGTPVTVASTELDESLYMVGMIVLRADSYEDALALAEQCPHLNYGGRVSVRRVGAGFVAVDGMSDW